MTLKSKKKKKKKKKNMHLYVINHQLPTTRALWMVYILLPSSKEITALYSRARPGGIQGQAQFIAKLNGNGLWIFFLSFFFFFFFVFLSFRVAPMAYGGSQTRGLIRAAAAGLRHSHSNTGPKPSLQLTPQLTAMPDP